MTDILLLTGLVGAVGVGIWYLMSQSTTTTPAQQGAAAAIQADSNAANQANANAAKLYAQSMAANNTT